MPLWESRLDHSHDIIATTGMKMLARFQGAWSVVVRRNPTFHEGEWIAYIDNLPDKANRDEFSEGRGKIVNPGFARDDTVVTDWYATDWNTGALKHEVPEDGEAWHLDRKRCFRLNKGWDMRAPNWVDSRPQADMRPSEQYGAEFIKRNQNSKLYKAQVFRTCVDKIKVNAWV